MMAILRKLGVKDSSHISHYLARAGGVLVSG